MFKAILLHLLLTVTELFVYTHSECNILYEDEQSLNLKKQLDPLNGQTFTAQFKDPVVSDEYQYTLNICNGVTVNGKLTAAGVIQARLDDPEQDYKKIGLISSTLIKGGTDWIMLTYQNGDPYRKDCGKRNRQAHLMIVCDPYHLKGKFNVLYEYNTFNETSDCFYLMELTSSVACNSGPAGLSSGSIFLIIFFTFSSVYVIIGAVYKRCVYGSKGWDQIPNIGFWKSFGNLQADGCNYLCRCTGSGYSSSRPYQGVADDQLEEEFDDEHLLPM